MPLAELGPFARGSAPHLAGHVVRLRGLPFTATLPDVLHFFRGVELAQDPAYAVFTCAPDGRPSGEAFVEVASAQAQQSALQRHKQQMGSRYIELFPASKGDALHAMQQNGYYTGDSPAEPEPAEDDSPAAEPCARSAEDATDTLRLRGLPFTAGPEDIQQFFAGTPALHCFLNTDMVQLLRKQQNRGPDSSACMAIPCCSGVPSRLTAEGHPHLLPAPGQHAGITSCAMVCRLPAGAAWHPHPQQVRSLRVHAEHGLCQCEVCQRYRGRASSHREAPQHDGQPLHRVPRTCARQQVPLAPCLKLVAVELAVAQLAGFSMLPPEPSAELLRDMCSAGSSSASKSHQLVLRSLCSSCMQPFGGWAQQNGPGWQDFTQPASNITVRAVTGSCS